MLTTIASCLVFTALLATEPANSPGKAEYLTNRQDLIIENQQAWGELGINICAHAPGQKGLPLQIGDKKYQNGLGHHAPGQILIDLNGQYDSFTADVGLQPLPSGGGTVVFKAFVDGQLKFDSGTMKTGDPAEPVSIPVAGASELRLEVTDAGDGITCDCANWAEARLAPSANPWPAGGSPRRLDVAPFARVVTSNPERMEGCKAGRVEEYRAEDVHLETDLISDASGSYAVPFTGNGPGVIGLRWLERRVLKELALEFPEGKQVASPEGVQIQYWVGESAWQGKWVPLKAEIKAGDGRWRAEVVWKNAPDLRKGTRRIRWILPASAKNTVVRKLIAVSPTPLEEVRLHVECDATALGDSARSSRPATIVLYNGEWAEPAGQRPAAPVNWNYRSGEPTTLALRYARPRPWKTDRTVLQFRFPNGGAFSVAIDDVLAQGQVYVKPYGLLVSRSPATTTLAEYRREIMKRETILEQVRHSPDQTFQQSIDKIHNPKQNLQPTMLSLACDNHKFVVHRDGLIQFAADPAKANEMSLYPLKNVAELRPTFGTGKNEGLTRRWEGWLPIETHEVRDGGLIYRQRVYVVPFEDGPLPEPGWLSPHPLFVAEFSVENPQAKPAPAALKLNFPPEMGGIGTGSRSLVVNSVADGGRLIACVDLADTKTLGTTYGDGLLRLTGDLPADEVARLIVYIPGWTLKHEDHAQLTGGRKLAERVAPYWNRILAPAAKIEVPDPLLMNVVKASQVHCLMAARNEADGQRIAAWIASYSYGPLESEANSIIRGMDYLGHHEFARRAHDFFIHRYNKAGFLTTGYTLMGTGWQVWTLGMHYDLTRNKEWLEKVAPDVARVCKWIMREREKTKQLGADGQKPPEYGLMPPGVMADWNAYAYHFCLNGYYYAALQAAAAALADINYPDTKAWLENAADFRDEIFRAYRWTQARMPVYGLRDGTFVPAYPSQVHSPGPLNHFFPGEDGNRSWCYEVELGPHHLVPLGVLAPESRDVTWMMNHYEDVQFVSDGWFDFPAERNQKDPFNYGGFAKVQPYYCRNAEVYAMRDDVKPFVRSYFNTIPSLLNMENLSFQEHFAGVAAWNKTHETGYFLHQTRMMLVFERKQELWLAPFVTSNWFKDGNVVGIENAPTHFGPMSFRIVSKVNEGSIEAKIEPPTRNAPEMIVLRLRHPEGKPMKAVTVNGTDHKDFDPARKCIRIKPQAGTIAVRATY